MNLADHLSMQARVLRLRGQLLPRAVNSQPAWNMLCDLASAYLEGKRVSITSACLASHGPPTTALRHIDALVDHGLAERQADPFDGRRQHLHITDAGFAVVKAAFGFTPLPCAINARMQPDWSVAPATRPSSSPAAIPSHVALISAEVQRNHG